MLAKQIFSSLAVASVLAGCASEPPPPPPAPPAPQTMAALMAATDAAVKAGKSEQALAILKTATRTYPADKAGWLRMAQVNFDSHVYGDAITHAQAALERDPDDIIAHSIVAVSGLRVASKALADLTQKNKLEGGIRAEAQDLAKLLRASIGGTIIDRQPKATAEVKAPATQVKAPATQVKPQAQLKTASQRKALANQLPGPAGADPSADLQRLLDGGQ